MSTKMDNLSNSYSKIHNRGKFTNTPSTSYIRPKSGLNLANLENIPKEIKNRLNLNNLRSSYSSHPHANMNNMKASMKLSQSRNECNKSIEFNNNNNNNNSKESFNQRQKLFSLTPNKLTTSGSYNPNRSASKNKVQSPTSNLLKSHRCHRYHTDLDFNYLANEKFLKDAVSCGKERLSTTALKSTSPEKYFYENRQSAKMMKNITSKNNTWDEKTNSEIYSREKEDEEATSYKKPSHGVLSDILDNQFSVNTPSRLKIYQSELDQIKNQEFKRNVSKSENETNNKIYHDDEQNNQLTVNLSYVGENPNDRFVEGLQSVLTYLDPIFERLSLQERVEKFLENLSDPKRTIRLGSIVALYLLLRKFQIEDNLKLLVLEKTIILLQDFESQEELFLVACLEICSIFAPHDILLENISLICMFLTDFNFPRLQKAAFNCIMSLEYAGIKTLVELASKDFQEYQRYILDSLIKTPHIQKIIIIRALLNEVYSSNADRRHSALAALNRMHDLVGDTDALTKMSRFFYETKIEKILLSSVMRTSGPEGEKILLNELKTNKDFSVRVAVASVLAYRVPKFPKYMKIILDNDDAYSITKNLPGSFCTYYGKVSPCVYEEQMQNNSNNSNIENNADVLVVNTRDFLASLQRMLIMNYDHSNPQIVHKGHSNLLESLNFSRNCSEVICKNKDYFELYPDDKDSNELKEEGKLLISEDVIKSLCHCLKDYSTAVRDTAAGSLGQIGLPEALLSVDYLVDSIKDEDVNVKSKVIWAIGIISAGCDFSVIPPVVEALRCNMWKVKSACLYTLSQFGYRCAKLALPVLVKLLKESAINKQTIAETMIKLGNEGESTLLRIMNAENDSNYKLKSSIAKALALCNVNSPNIDFIVECLFKMTKANNPIIRKNAFFAIRVLAEKTDEKVTYLKRKNLIPFYYEMMIDKEPSIQSYAINCIRSLGPQGELIFIEGLTKDINPSVRQNSAVGLAEIGPHTLRTLLIGLHDENFLVRKTVEKEIMEKFSIDSILEIFGKEKTSQRLSLKIAIRDILEKDLPINAATKLFFQNILVSFEKDLTDSTNNYLRDSGDNAQRLNKNNMSNNQATGKFSNYY